MASVTHEVKIKYFNMPQKKKYYVVVSKGQKHVYGAFDFSKEGWKKAKDYAKLLKQDGGEFEVVEGK